MVEKSINQPESLKTSDSILESPSNQDSSTETRPAVNDFDFYDVFINRGYFSGFTREKFPHIPAHLFIIGMYKAYNQSIHDFANMRRLSQDPDTRTLLGRVVTGLVGKRDLAIKEAINSELGVQALMAEAEDEKLIASQSLFNPDNALAVATEFGLVDVLRDSSIPAIAALTPEDRHAIEADAKANATRRRRGIKAENNTMGLGQSRKFS